MEDTLRSVYGVYRGILSGAAARTGRLREEKTYTYIIKGCRVSVIKNTLHQQQRPRKRMIIVYIEGFANIDKGL